MVDYVALLSKEAESDYGVDFPDFPGCVTAGTTPEEALEWAQEALLLHIRGVIDDGEPLPEPTSLESIVSDPENADGKPFIVTVPDRAIQEMLAPHQQGEQAPLFAKKAPEATKEHLQAYPMNRT
jgi:predicted RNase H-like HicB family nuclease